MEAERARAVLLRGMLATLREAHGPGFCRRNIVKPLVKLLRPPAHVSHISPELEHARVEAEQVLHALCQTCPYVDCKRHE